ncbi:hypothetical protein K474DRAFT_1658294 [Panus rudis PR-1116 ss-1]|nr:hypothetical protein K474DRAFT_1658294 [Panus rudis PR-1116 ss-1]
MSSESGLKPRQTRSSIRHSLGTFITGVTGAIASDNKEKNGAEKEKHAKKTKEASVKRSSLVAPRPSLDKQFGGKGDTDSPENKTVTKQSRRLSGIPKSGPVASPDDRNPSPASKPLKATKSPIGRSASLRPRPRVSGNGSSLPKYRPRSVLIESNKKPPSPARLGTRRKLGTSDDEREDPKGKGAPLLQLDAPQSAEKHGRPISPLPHRNALKVNVTLNTRPTTPERSGSKPSSSPSPQTTPSRKQMSATKVAKSSHAKAASVSVRSTIPRPPSSASSSSSTSRTPRTPKTPNSVRNLFAHSSNNSNKQSGPSPLRTAIPSPGDQESPLGRLSAQKRGKRGTPTAPGSNRSTPTPSIFTEGASTDSVDANDVEFLLGSGASPTKPTPAVPRFRRTAPDSDDSAPQTPCRSSPFLLGRTESNFLAPAPPSSTDSSPFLRPKLRSVGNDRGSILSFEQLAAFNRSLNGEDPTHMLSDISAPFRPGAISPAPSSLPDIPESPSLSALSSPTGYGSISQVLLPDVTPSPAVHNVTQRFEAIAASTANEPEIAQVDSAIVTLLRLQLASAQNQAKERLSQIQYLENQLHNAKEARIRDAEELARQVSVLEEQVQGNLQSEEQRTEYTARLEEQLTHAHEASERAMLQAVEKAREEAALAKELALKRERSKWELSNLAATVVSTYGRAFEEAEGSLDLIGSSRDMLAVMKAGLDQAYRRQQQLLYRASA